MWTIFKLQWLRLFKQPILIMMFLGLTVVFVYFMGSSQGSQQITVQTYTDDLNSQEMNNWLDLLNEEEVFVFEESDEQTITEDIRMNEIPFALEINTENFRFLVGREDMEISTIFQHVDQVFTREKRIQEIEDKHLEDSLTVESYITLETQASTETASSNEVFQTAVLVGMSLYFSVFSILYLMVNLIEEKKLGTWNRLIFSPISKVKIYLGQLLHYFLVGLLQIFLSFVILTRLVGIDMGTNYLAMFVIVCCFVFAIVSLGLLIMGIVDSSQQLQVVIPIVATSMAMMGGAFWPLEVVNNRILLFLAELMPIKYGIQGLMGAVIQERGLTELMEPIVSLLLMGVLFMGIGINLMERVSEKRSM